jgi:hypothetical protein
MLTNNQLGRFRHQTAIKTLLCGVIQIPVFLNISALSLPFLRNNAEIWRFSRMQAGQTGPGEKTGIQLVYNTLALWTLNNNNTTPVVLQGSIFFLGTGSCA